MKRRLVVVTLTLLVGLALPITASATHYPLHWWYRQAPQSRELRGGCESWAKIWVQEQAQSGITRLGAKFELRAPNDPGIPGLAYQSKGYYYSGYFPNDYLSYQSSFGSWFRYFIGPRFKIRVVMVGERPSLWQRNKKLAVDLSPAVGCDGSGGIFSLAPAGGIAG